MTDKGYDDFTLRKVQQCELEILRDFIDICEKHHLCYFGLGGTAIGAIRHGGFIPWDDDIDVALPRADFDKFVEIAKRDYQDKYTIVNGVDFPNFPLLTTRWTMNGTQFVEWPLKDLDVPLGIFLDIYPLDKIPDDEKLFKKQARKAFFYSKLLILRSIPKPVLAFKGFKASVVHFICGIIHFFLKTFRFSKEKLYKKCLEVSTIYNHLDSTKRIDFLCNTTAYMSIIELEDIFPLRKIQFEDVELNFPNKIEKHLEHCFGDFMTPPPLDKRKNHLPYILKFNED